MKKGSVLVIIIALVCCWLPTAYAQETQDMTEHLIYEINDGEVTVNGVNDRDIKGDFYIPETIEGYPVTGIADNAFSVCGEITGIKIPDTVKRIGEGAFAKCVYLKEIDLGKGVESIGKEAFWDCFSLKEIRIPASVNKIEVGRSVFFECEDLEKIEVEDGNGVYYCEGNCIIEKETKKLIAGCTTSVIPPNITAIADGAFTSGLKSETANIPGGVREIGEGAFKYGDFTLVIIPEGVLEIKGDCFRDCASLEKVVLPQSIRIIEEYAFLGCDKITGVEFMGSMEQWEKVKIETGNERILEKVSCENAVPEKESVNVSANLNSTVFLFVTVLLLILFMFIFTRKR